MKWIDKKNQCFQDLHCFTLKQKIWSYLCACEHEVKKTTSSSTTTTKHKNPLVFSSDTTHQSISLFDLNIRWHKTVCCYVCTAILITGSWPTTGIPEHYWQWHNKDLISSDLLYVRANSQEIKGNKSNLN